MKANIFSRLLRTVLMVCTLAASAHAAADTMLMVSLDTSKYGNGNAGYLDFVFGGSDGALPASATMKLLDGFDSDPAAFELTGDVAAVPGGFVFQNSINYNSAFYHATFGNTLSFMLTLAGDLSGLELSGFSVIALDAAGELLSDSLLTLAFVQQPGGGVEALPLAIDSDVAAVAAVPEPGALALAALGLLMLAVVRRRA